MKLNELLNPRKLLNRFSFTFDPHNYNPEDNLSDGGEFIDELPNIEENPLLSIK